jgi:hypothetical protein
MNKALRGVLIGGSIAATLDIVYAFIMAALVGRSPTWVLQFVASGLLGEKSFEGGMPAATLGLLAHFGILFGAAALYYAASRRLPWLRQRAVICGLLFGVGVYLFMNFVIVPLSAVPFESKHTASRLAQGFVSHAVLVGLPIALAIRRYGGPAEESVR